IPQSETCLLCVQGNSLAPARRSTCAPGERIRADSDERARETSRIREYGRQLPRQNLPQPARKWNSFRERHALQQIETHPVREIERRRGLALERISTLASRCSQGERGWLNRI